MNIPKEKVDEARQIVDDMKVKKVANITTIDLANILAKFNEILNYIEAE